MAGLVSIEQGQYGPRRGRLTKFGTALVALLTLTGCAPAGAMPGSTSTDHQPQAPATQTENTGGQQTGQTPPTETPGQPSSSGANTSSPNAPEGGAVNNGNRETLPDGGETGGFSNEFIKGFLKLVQADYESSGFVFTDLPHVDFEKTASGGVWWVSAATGPDGKQTNPNGQVVCTADDLKALGLSSCYTARH